MKLETRHALDAYKAKIAQLNGVNDSAMTFSVEPSIQQRLESKMQESSAFLQKINMVGVDELEAEKIGMGVSGPIASTTKRDGVTPRKPVNVMSLDSHKYRCEPINYDTYVLYRMLDAWSKFPDFQIRLANLLLTRQALDRIMIGWNGIAHVEDSKPLEKPMREDVAIGWLQQYRNNADERVIAEGKASGKLLIGPSAAADYKNVDAVVVDAINNLIDVWHQDRTDMVVICGRKLLSDKYFPLVNADQKPTETLAADIIMSQKRLGGLPAVRVPYFPPNAMLVTPLSNLSIYYQASGRRRYLKEEPELNRITNFESSNDAFVVEDYGAGCLIENIEAEV